MAFKQIKEHKEIQDEVISKEDCLDVFNCLVNVEIQAQHWPDRLCKPSTGSVWTDRLGRIGA